MKASRVPHKNGREAAFAFASLNESWISWLGLGLAVAVGIAYFMSARFGLAFRAKPGGVAVFWPAAGIAIGALIALGPDARLPVAAAVAIATVTSKLLITGNLWLGVIFGVVCAGQTLLTAWLIERWFGRAFKLEDVSQVLGFLVASAIGAAMAAVGAVAAVSLVNSAASPLDVWRLWFASCLLGTVTVAPLLIGLGEAVRELPPRSELIEGVIGIVTLAVLSIFVISLPQGPWATALPAALVFPVLLWVAVRCRPVFAAAATFVVALAVIWSATFDLGHFGDPSTPLADRILAAQTLVLAGALLPLVLAALFADRRRSDAELKQSKERLQLALDGAELGAFSVDLATGNLNCDARTARIHGHSMPPMTIKEGRRFVHPDDLAHIDAAFAEVEHAGGPWNAEYRVLYPPDHPHAGEARWIAFEGTVQCNAQGMPERLLGVARDITQRKRAEQVLADLNVQRALAGKAGLVGSYSYDTDTEVMRISPGYAAIQGFPEGTAEVTRNAWLAGVHPEDVGRLQVLRSEAFSERLREYNMEYRIVRGGEVRWIESRSFISYGNNGNAQRVIGVNIDVTERKQAEALLNESKARLADAMAAGRVIAFEWDAVTRLSQRCANATDILGFELGGTAGSPRNDFLSYVHADDRASLKTRIRELHPRDPTYALSFRFVRPDSRQVWLEETAKGEFDATGRLLRIKGLTRDITERKEAELTLAERTMQLALAERAALVGSVAYDNDTEKMQISTGYAAIHDFPDGTTEIARNEWLAGVHPEDVERLEKLRRGAFRKRSDEYSADYRIVRSGGEVRWIEARSFVSYRRDGRPHRVVGVNIDVTERKRAEEQQRALNAELDHRVKNVLATVSAIITQTEEAGSSQGDFVAGLKRRINSLARTHELLSQSNWRGVSLAEIVRREFAPYATGNAEVAGPNVILKAEATQAVATVIHELTTNAAKYGAFSNRNGRVSLRWRWLQNGSHDRLIIEWQEIGGPPVLAPSKSGYGTSVIRELIPFELGGVVELAFAFDGTRCRLEIPADWVSGGRRLIENPGVLDPAQAV